HRDRYFLILCDGRQHVVAQFALAQPKRRRGNVQYEIPAPADQFLHGIDAIEPPVPEALVVPGVLADGQSHLLAAKAEQLLALGRSKVAHLVEDVIGGQQHLRLDEFDASLAQQGGGVHHFFARVTSPQITAMPCLSAAIRSMVARQRATNDGLSTRSRGGYPQTASSGNRISPAPALRACSANWTILAALPEKSPTV